MIVCMSTEKIWCCEEKVLPMMRLIGNYICLSVKVIGDIDYDIVSKKCKVVVSIFTCGH